MFMRGDFYFRPIKTLSSRHESADLGAGDSWWDKRMTIVQFDRGSLVLPPKAVIDFLLKLDQADDCATERRDSERRTAVMEVAVVPVDFELAAVRRKFLGNFQGPIIHRNGNHSHAGDSLRQRRRGDLESRREHVATPGLRRPMRCRASLLRNRAAICDPARQELESATLLAPLFGHDQFCRKGIESWE